MSVPGFLVDVPLTVSHLSNASLLRPLEESLRTILLGRLLTPRFQPILDLSTGQVLGYEGLVRGPSNTPLHNPVNLFRVARHCRLLVELESCCLQVLAQAYGASGQTACLFVNVSPTALMHAFQHESRELPDLSSLGLSPGQVVIELTESDPTLAWEPLLAAADHYRDRGFSIALDDLGEGFASLRLWSALRPDFVKIDSHFVQGVSFDPVKHQFLRSIQELAMRTGARTVAEGLESEADLATVQELGIGYGQGYVLGRPAAVPLQPQISWVRRRQPAGPEGLGPTGPERVTAAHLLQTIPPVTPGTSVLEVERRFAEWTALQSLPVVKAGIPLGLVNRHAFQEFMARPFSRELYGKQSCSRFMEKEILVVDHQTSLHELSQLIVESDPRHILFGFAITQNGCYLGMGSGHALMKEITRLQIHAARYANPLTLLPGNVPIHESMDGLLAGSEAFAVAYADLDHFKPFNDVYGYRKGDEIIQWTARLLRNVCDPYSDFLGHIGGDDFILILRSTGWQGRLESLLEAFQSGVGAFFSQDHRELGGYDTEDRQGHTVRHPLVSLSLGVIRVVPGQYLSHHEVSAAASAAKKMAKQQQGSSLFIDRRTGSA